MKKWWLIDVYRGVTGTPFLYSKYGDHFSIAHDDWQVLIDLPNLKVREYRGQFSVEALQIFVPMPEAENGV